MKRAAVLIWGASLLLARLIGLVRERALGVTLGAGPEADVYQAAFRVPDLINYLVAGGALSIVFIPLFTAHLERKDTVRAWRTFSVIANFLVLLLGGLTVAGEIWMPVLVGWLAPGFTEGQLEQLCHLSRIILPAQMFHLIGGLLGASLLAQEKHAAPALAPLIYTVPVIAGGLLSGSAEGFAWGTLVGAILGPFGVPLWAALRSGLQWTAVLDLRDSDFRTYLVRSLEHRRDGRERHYMVRLRARRRAGRAARLRPEPDARADERVRRRARHGLLPRPEPPLRGREEPGGVGPAHHRDAAGAPARLRGAGRAVGRRAGSRRPRLLGAENIS